jgi:hypothetical protein
MLSFLTSLSFLYLIILVLLAIYGLIYYRNFTRNGYQPRLFPWVFTLIGLACFCFLYFNMHPPLRLQTFSNLDHHFIRHDGFQVAGQIELGRSDTVNGRNNSYNSFLIAKKDNKVSVSSSYAEEPFYILEDGSSQMLSKNYPSNGHEITLRDDTVTIKLAEKDKVLGLWINGKQVANRKVDIKKGASTWELLRDDIGFMQSAWYTDEKIGNILRSIQLVRSSADDQRSYFISGRIFHFARDLHYDDKNITATDLVFSAVISDKAVIGWGNGFPGNNKNQFRLEHMPGDSFSLKYRYPLAYPLTEEPQAGNKFAWVAQPVNKFLVADPLHIGNVPAVFTEGFLFTAFPGDTTVTFKPALLTYRKDAGNAALDLQVIEMGRNNDRQTSADQILLPSNSGSFSWQFSIVDSFNWQLGDRILTPSTWQKLIFGGLLLFFLLVFFSSWLKPANQLSWVGQVLSCIVLVMLTTRYFLYWRYKSFPPYEGMDLPSIQQLNSFWNFGIILLVTFVLAIVFGFDILKYIYRQVSKRTGAFLQSKRKRTVSGDQRSSEEKLLRRLPLLRRFGAKAIFFGSWIFILLAAASITLLSGFDAAISRHLALALILLYFLYVYISCRYSPLVVSSAKSWWNLHTGDRMDLIISNPVKVLLSVSLLGLFLFIDIGFALVFFNFLLFNEAFLFINYSIAGLSTGSKRNAALFGLLGFIYLLLFALNLIYGPYLFKYLLELSTLFYGIGYLCIAILIGWSVGRLFKNEQRKKIWARVIVAGTLFSSASFFLPKDWIREKAAITKYRIDVLTTPTDRVIEKAYTAGDSYIPVIRAAQNQWFINSFIDVDNNPSVNKAEFQLLPHAPQNRGAKYNAQATDLVSSRFLIAEHGRWSVLLYILLLYMPMALLAYFYKLYPDFTNRVNPGYAVTNTVFSLLNYLLITALLVILAATGRYIFFGQDLPFGSILSKQSLLFPALIIVIVVLMFRKIPLQQYPNRGKLIPGGLIFAGLFALLFFVRPAFNREKEFTVAGLSENLRVYTETRLQPIWDEIDTAVLTRRLSLAAKDKRFSEKLKEMLAAGSFTDGGSFLRKQIEQYSRSGFSKHLDANRMFFLDLSSGRPRLAINDNFFHAEPPPHLRQAWAGNVFADSSVYNVSLWDAGSNSMTEKRFSGYGTERTVNMDASLQFTYRRKIGEDLFAELCLVNHSGNSLGIRSGNGYYTLHPGDTMSLKNPAKYIFSHPASGKENILLVQPDAFMKNYYVNGSRFYLYPLANDLVWARNFAEGISGERTSNGDSRKDVFISMDQVLTDSLSSRIKQMLYSDTAYKDGAGYAIAIADADGRIWSIPDHIKGFDRPDPNDKAAFNRAIYGDGMLVRQSALRKKIGNINLLRMNPGPGSTLKPILFSSIASQLPMDWNAFAAEGFSQKQNYFGGEKVAEYDFEKNNGRITSVSDYLKYSDNYYHANLLLLGSYSRQGLQNVLSTYFARTNPADGLHWPYFNYNGQYYWLNGFENWPGYASGKANFGSDSSFISVGLFENYGIHTYRNGKYVDRFENDYDSALFGNAWKRSGFILPEYSLFDQKGTGMNMSRPNEVFLSSFRGHVKGSSQVMIPPLKMVDAFGKMVSQNRNYTLTLNPRPREKDFAAFYVDNGVTYNDYLSLMREGVFRGMKEALFTGTAARLGTMLKNGSPYFYFAKTGTTGDDELKTKSKLFTLIISQKDISDPGFSFRKNKFVVIYFTSQDGPAKQNEEFQASVIRMIEGSEKFRKYMGSAQ